MPEDTPVLDTLADMTAASIERSSLEAREHMIARLAALVATGAPPVSYLLNAGTATEVGITMEDVQGVLVAVAPIVGTSRVVAAGGNIARALGFAIAVAEAELRPSWRPSSTPRTADRATRSPPPLNPLSGRPAPGMFAPFCGYAGIAGRLAHRPQSSVRRSRA
jgi:hypothetical protein